VSASKATRGRLLTVTVRAGDGSTDGGELAGTLSGEPLHFIRAGDGGRWSAIGAVPIDAPDTLPLTVVVARRAGGSGGSGGVRAADTLVVAVPVAAGSYRTEVLRVAPEFGREPDSALAARIDRENAQARALGVAAHATPRLWRSPFVLPRPGRVTSGFGTARTFNGAVQSRHMGVDFAGAVGAPVRAAGRGVVALVADFYLAGTAVYVDHGGGLVTGYFHLSRADVARGDTVERSQVIGRVGRTGRVTGPHLHWVMRYGAVSLDPRSVLGIEAAGDDGRRGAGVLTGGQPPAAGGSSSAPSPAARAAPRRPRAG
jgi:murein DD-endopeptidase MepM/ murein hydrolase activator NlpD